MDDEIKVDLADPDKVYYAIVIRRLDYFYHVLVRRNRLQHYCKLYCVRHLNTNHMSYHWRYGGKQSNQSQRSINSF